MKKLLCITLTLMIILSLTVIDVSAKNNSFIKIEAEFGRVMALKSDGTVWAWGDNVNGFLCDGTSVDRYAPVKVEGIEGIVDIAMSWWHTALLAGDGTVWYWGNDGDFQMDLGKPLHIPQKRGLSTWNMVKGTSNVQSEDYIASDSSFDMKSGIGVRLVIKKDGTVWMVKYEQYYDGDLGYLRKNEESLELKEFFGAKDVAIDNGTYYIVCSDGSVVSKGANYSGQLGNGFSDYVSAPLKKDGISNAKKVCSTKSRYDDKKDFCYFILHTDGTVSMYDDSDAGSQITNIPIENVSNIIANEYMTLALKDDGTVWTWDINSHEFNVRIIEELSDMVSIFSINGELPMLSYGAIDKIGNIYIGNVSLLDGFLGGLLEQENMQDQIFGKITGIADSNNSIQYLNFNIILDGVGNTARITSVQYRNVDCIFPLQLINSDGFFMKLFRESIDNLNPVFNGEIAAYNFTISKEDGRFIGHSVLKPIEDINSNIGIGEFTDIGCDFSVDGNGVLYYTGSITELNHNFFPLSPYGYQTDWKKIVSSVITLKIGNNTMFKNNIESTIPAPPIIVDGRTLIPIREVIEALGGQVEWDRESSAATIMMPESKLVLTIGSLNCSVNDKIVVTDVAPQIIDNKTYLPLRFVCENIGATVYWEEVDGKITIVK